jgi:hypothetical protein
LSAAPSRKIPGIDKNNSVVEERQQNDDRDRHAEKPKQYSAAHGFSPVANVPAKQATAEFVPSNSIAEKYSRLRRVRETETVDLFGPLANPARDASADQRIIACRDASKGESQTLGTNGRHADL